MSDSILTARAVTRVFTGGVMEGLIGVTVTALIIWLLTRRKTRAVFDR